MALAVASLMLESQGTGQPSACVGYQPLPCLLCGGLFSTSNNAMLEAAVLEITGRPGPSGMCFATHSLSQGASFWTLPSKYMPGIWLHPFGFSIKAMWTWVAGLGTGGNRLPTRSETSVSSALPMAPGSPGSVSPHFAPSLVSVHQAFRVLSCSDRVLTDSFLVP